MPESESFCLRFDHASIKVKCSSPELSARLKEYLRLHVRPEEDCHAGLEVHLQKVLSPIPTHARLALRYYGLKIFFHSGRTYFTDFRSYLTLDESGRKAEAYVSPETIEESGMHFLTHIFFTISLFEMLRHQGVFFLHSAALVSPEGKGYVFPASAGQGKSTLAVYLLRRGYKYLSDDTIFLTQNGKSLNILGFEKVSHLSEEVIGRFAELKIFSDAPRLENRGKQLVDLEKAFPGSRVHENRKSGAIIFLNRVANGKSALKPMSRLEAFHQLLGQNPFAYINPGLAQKHLDIFKQFVAQNQVWLLESGKDWIENPNVLQGLMEGAVSERKNQ